MYTIYNITQDPVFSDRNGRSAIEDNTVMDQEKRNRIIVRTGLAGAGAARSRPL